LLALALTAEAIFAAVLLSRPQAAAPTGPTAAPASLTRPAVSLPASNTVTLRDGRTIDLIGLGGPRTAPLLTRIAAQTDDAVGAVTAFWGGDWRHDIVIVAAGSDEQFRAVAGGSPDVAATTTEQRIVFAPGAAAMSDGALRIVLRHELFHYAARTDTALDAPRWLTEGVADFVARPAQPRPGPAQAATLAALPGDADLDTPGPARTLAYDRAWWFSRFVDDRYGTATLRSLYERACGPGHPDVATAVRDTLGADLPEVLSGWRHWLTG
jgi:hypothetical protein